MTYMYACLMRPPMPGAIPREGLDYVDFYEGETKDTHQHYWGAAAYTRELTKDEVAHYDLKLIEILGQHNT